MAERSLGLSDISALVALVREQASTLSAYRTERVALDAMLAEQAAALARVEAVLPDLPRCSHMCNVVSGRMVRAALAGEQPKPTGKPSLREQMNDAQWRRALAGEQP